MSRFSEMLNEFVRRSGYSNSRAAQMCGVERTLFQKYLNGSRTPQEDFPIDLLASQLLLTPEERRDWKIELQKLYLGEDVYDRFERIYWMLRKYSQVVTEPVIPNAPLPELNMKLASDVIVVHGKSDVQFMIRSLLEYEYRDQGGKLFLRIQPECGDLLHTVWEISRRKNLEIHHILCMEQELAGEPRGVYNLQILESVLPLFMLNDKYQIRYYYDHVKSHFSKMIAFPYFLVSRNASVIIDFERETAIMSKNPDVRECYRRHFETMWKKSSPMITFHTDMGNLDEYSRKSAALYALQNTPSLKYSMTEEELYQLVSGGDERRKTVAAGLSGIRREREEKARWGKKPIDVTFFTEQGLRTFLEEGVISEYSQSFYNPPTAERRITVVERFCRDLEDGIREVHMLDPSFAPDQRLKLQAYGDSVICIFYYQENAHPIFLLHEGSLIRAFREYLEWLKDCPMVFSVEKTLEKIRSILAEYREREEQREQ